ncbi:trypsin-like peptidase domain-containing protein [Polyangium sp. y55x31]|uniref:trypsin-like peptidase domain-containing protein n=1 Tax=Polyangium sp. y55x31 TaxID=3042688 RepID=UPI0024827FB0|nr:trypsin-like peptidase domain-containing protein [Polyangium sp. y55x31]MDI1480391.1 trypsin-like peptidase domain-containing protein [Polyangium sp. y55x31]
MVHRDALQCNIERAAWLETLARKYPTIEDARLFVDKVGLNPIRIGFHVRADVTWFNILEEARRQGGRWPTAVLDLAVKEHSHDEALLRLLDGAAVRYAEGPNINTLGWQGRGGQTLERIWGKQSALVPVSFLEVGMRCARAVARIRVADGSLGTGFLVEEDLLVTNHHVLRDREAAAGAILNFNHQKTADGRDAEVEEGRLDPGSFFATSEEDDCTIVEVHGNPTARWGAIALRSAPIKRDDRVNIIQHPGGDQKQLSFFHNLVEYVGAGRVQYLTDTLPGSSGSPVFDKDWQLVALHHSGGWITEPGSRDRFFRNEGIHVDRILDLLRRSR